MAEATVFVQDPGDTTLAEARIWLEKESKGSKGAHCPCCQKKERTYGRKVTPVQAAVLVLLYRTYNIGEVVNLQDFASTLSNPELVNGRELNRVVYWDLLEATENEKLFRLCDGGYFFAFKGHKITEKVWIKDEVVVGREGKIVGITDVLGNKFDLNELLTGPIPPKQMTISQGES
jgi:hypothetical protein